MRMRLDMVDDLISNYNLVGQSVSQIEALLGKSEKDCKSANCRMRYNLGPCRGFGIAYGSLVINFKDGIATEVYKVCH